MLGPIFIKKVLLIVGFVGIAIFFLWIPACSLLAENCCQVGTGCVDNVTKHTCNELNGIYYPKATCITYTQGKFCSEWDSKKGKWVRVGKLGFNDSATPLYNTGTGSSCEGRQYAAYNYPVNYPIPNPPQLALVDGDGNPIRVLHTKLVTDLFIVGAIIQLYRDNGWISQGDTIVVWAFGTLPLEGSFPDTFCYDTNEYYGLISNASIPPAIKDTIVVISWYSTDTLGVSDIDFMTMAVLPPRGPIPTLSQWVLIILAMLVLGSGIWLMLKRRRAVRV